MSTMSCPSDYRSGDEYHPSSPWYEGGDEQSETIILPFNFMDEHEVEHRALLNVEYSTGSERDDYPIIEPTVLGVTMNGVDVSLDKIDDDFGGVPEAAELTALIKEAWTWEKLEYISYPLSDPDGKDLNVRLGVHYRTFPPIDESGQDRAFEVRDIFAGSYVIVNESMQNLNVFMKDHPSVQLPGAEDLLHCVTEHHAMTYPKRFSQNPAASLLRRM